MPMTKPSVIDSGVDLDRALCLLEEYQQRAKRTQAEIMELVNKVSAIETEARAQAITAIARIGLFADNTAEAYDMVRRAIVRLKDQL